MGAPGTTSIFLVRSLFWTYAVCGPGSSTAIHPLGIIGAWVGTGSVPAFKKVIEGDFSSGFVCTAVVAVRGAARAVEVAAISAVNARSLFFMRGGNGSGGGSAAASYRCAGG